MASGNFGNANRYKGKDIDNDGDGKVDSADDADTLQGFSANRFNKQFALNRESIARSRHELNLSDLDFDGGFFDIFRNTSKIEGSSNVSISTLAGGDTDGKVELRNLDDAFEDGDYTDNWSVNQSDGSVSVQQNTVINGSYSLVLDGSGGTDLSTDIQVYHDRGSNDSISDGDIYQFWFNAGTMSSYGGFGWSIGDGIRTSSKVSGSVELRTTNSGTVQIRTGSATKEIGSSLSAGTDYKVEVEFDVTNSQVTTRLYDSSGSQLDSATQAYNGSSSYRYITLYNTQHVKTYFDDVSYLEGGGGYTLSGYIVEREDLSSGDDSFSNPPETVTLFDDADIQVNENIEYTIRDINGSGTSKTVTRSDLESQVDLSDFTGFLVEVQADLTSSDGNDTPTLKMMDFTFKEATK